MNGKNVRLSLHFRGFHKIRLSRYAFFFLPGLPLPVPAGTSAGVSAFLLPPPFAPAFPVAPAPPPPPAAAAPVLALPPLPLEDFSRSSNSAFSRSISVISVLHRRCGNMREERTHG